MEFAYSTQFAPYVKLTDHLGQGALAGGLIQAGQEAQWRARIATASQTQKAQMQMT